MEENQARIFYLLSDQGRKRLLLRGGDGKREQVAWGTPPTDADIDLFKIDSENYVSLDLTTTPFSAMVLSTSYHRKYEELTPGNSRATLLWDIVPTWEDLIAFAREAEAHWAKEADEHDNMALQELAEQQDVEARFFADPNARAEKIQEDCVTVGGVDFWGSETTPIIKEALARSARDLEERRKANRRTLANFIENHGSDNQRQRLAAGLLPWQEANDALEAHLYSPLKDFPVYQRFTVEEVCKCVETGFMEEACKPTFKATDATELSAKEWETFAAVKKCVPLATFQLREHRAACAAFVPAEVRRGVIVKFDVDNLKFKREFGL